MIRYIEKGIELFDEIEKQGYKLINVNNEWISDNDEAVQRIIDEFIPVNPLPDITPRQFRQAFVLAGKSLSDVDAFIQTLPEPQRSLAFVEWEYSTAFQRNNRMLNELAPAFGISQEQLDDIFKLGATL